MVESSWYLLCVCIHFAVLVLFFNVTVLCGGSVCCTYHCSTWGVVSVVCVQVNLPEKDFSASLHVLHSLRPIHPQTENPSPHLGLPGCATEEQHLWSGPGQCHPSLSLLCHVVLEAHPPTTS